MKRGNQGAVHSLGKSGYLPDISSAFGFWRSYSVNAVEKKDYNAAASGLNNINSLLTEEYIITVNTTKYNESVDENITYQCRSCDEITSLLNIEVCDILLSATDSVITGKKTSRQWFCKACKHWTPQNQTSMVKSQNASPFYSRVVPTCPIRKIGLLGRNNFSTEFDRWFYNFLEELQHALAIYRIEYVSQHDGEDMKDDQKFIGEINDLSN